MRLLTLNNDRKDADLVIKAEEVAQPAGTGRRRKRKRETRVRVEASVEGMTATVCMTII